MSFELVVLENMDAFHYSLRCDTDSHREVVLAIFAQVPCLL